MVNSHLFNKTIPLAIIVIFLFIFFLFKYKSPIDIENNEDKSLIIKMIKEHNANSKIEDIEIKSGVIYVPLKDSIYKLSDKIKNDNDILQYTKVVKYVSINDSDTIKCATIFEVDEEFLKEKVGKHLITIKDLN